MSLRRSVSLLVGMLLMVGGASSSMAQETTGRLTGRVLDGKGEPVPFASVTVTSAALQGGRGTQTGAQGMFVLLGLPVGSYSLRITQMGYQSRVLENIPVRLGLSASLEDIRLEPQVYPVDSVEVTAHAVLDPASTVLGENLSARDYESLPVQRDYRALPALLPHINGDDFAGGTVFENHFSVDGIDVSYPVTGGPGTVLPYNFIQELEVRTGGYGAEYRGALGGTMDAITYSGGNQVVGQVFGYFTGNGLSATPRSLPSQPDPNQDFSLYDLGFRVGGPVVRDRLWYFAAYNPTFQTEDVPIPGLGTYQDVQRIHSFAGKLTWRANERNTVVLTGLGDPSSGRTVGGPPGAPAAVDPYLNRGEGGSIQVAGEGRHLAGEGLLLKSRLSYSERREDWRPDTELGQTTPYTYRDSTGAFSGGGRTSLNHSRALAASLNATWVRGEHEVKAGAEYRDTRFEFDRHSGIVTQLFAPYYELTRQEFVGHVGSRSPSLFVQHAWRPTPRLQIQDGLRWDGEYIISSDGRVAQSLLEGWQPRLGLT